MKILEKNEFNVNDSKAPESESNTAVPKDELQLTESVQAKNVEKKDDEKNPFVEETKEHNEKVIKGSKPVKKAKLGFGKVKVLNIVLSVRHLSIMLKSGLAIEDALKVIAEQSIDPKLRVIFADLENEVHSGKSISESMRKYPKVFSGVVVSLINAGEQGGTLEKNLIFLADYLKKDYDLKKKIKGALFYPIMVFGITILEFMGVIFFILPKLEPLFFSFKNVSSFSIFIITTAKFLRDNVLFIALGLIVLGFGFKMFLGTKLGKRFKDKVALNFPIIKELNKNSILTTFSRTLGILLQSGIPITNALQITSQTTDNGIYSKILLKIYTEVKDGKNLSEAMAVHKGYFPPTFMKMIEVGEETGTLEENLEYLHDFYAEEVEEMTNNLTTLIEPLLLVFIGVMVGLLAISIVGPIYQLTSSVND